MNFYRKRAEDHSLSISNQVKHKHLKTDNTLKNRVNELQITNGNSLPTTYPDPLDPLASPGGILPTHRIRQNLPMKAPSNRNSVLYKRWWFF